LGNKKAQLSLGLVSEAHHYNEQEIQDRCRDDRAQDRVIL